MITAQFNDSFPPIADGVANGVKNYALWLNRKYGKAYAVVPEYPDYTDNEEFEVIRYISLPYPPRKPYRMGLHNISFKTQKILSEIPFDILHARSPFSAGQFAIQTAADQKIPLVASFHSQYYYDIKEQVYSEKITQLFIQRIVAFYNKADSVWTVNKKTAGTLREYGYKGDIFTIGNGTDLSMPENYDELRNKIDQTYKIKKDEFVMLYTGQIIWHKNLRLIAEGLAEIKKAGKKFKMFFVGMGEAEEELDELILNLGLKDNIIRTGQISDREALKNIYARADLFLFPSIYDTFGIVVREAAALGCPCILIENSNASEGIRDMENGFLCENEKMAFAQKLMNIMENRDILKKVSENAMMTLPESWEKVVDKAYLKYVEVIKEYSEREKNVRYF